tara:strand:+ start:3019 stop:3810 length:792 start_codon:yes stop_codon:yes gene_type:complete
MKIKFTLKDILIVIVFCLLSLLLAYAIIQYNSKYGTISISSQITISKIHELDLKEKYPYLPNFINFQNSKLSTTVTNPNYNDFFDHMKFSSKNLKILRRYLFEKNSLQKSEIDEVFSQINFSYSDNEIKITISSQDNKKHHKILNEISNILVENSSKVFINISKEFLNSIEIIIRNQDLKKFQNSDFNSSIPVDMILINEYLKLANETVQKLSNNYSDLATISNTTDLITNNNRFINLIYAVFLIAGFFFALMYLNLIKSRND